MNILDLLEAELYRYQQEWENAEEPVIQMQGRESRSTLNGWVVNAYGMHYALTKLGYDVPKRWKSSFCTTDAKKSMYINMVDDKHLTGLRLVVVPQDRECGWVRNDFNNSMSMSFLDTMLSMISNLERWQQNFSIFQKENPEVYAQFGKLKDMGNAFQKTNKLSDEGYAKFVEYVTAFDAICDKIQPSQDLTGGNATNTWIPHVKSLVDDGFIGVATVGSLPDRPNLEVWFEGPYEAHKVDVDDVVER